MIQNQLKVELNGIYIPLDSLSFPLRLEPLQPICFVSLTIKMIPSKTIAVLNGKSHLFSSWNFLKESKLLQQLQLSSFSIITRFWSGQCES